MLVMTSQPWAAEMPEYLPDRGRCANAALQTRVPSYRVPSNLQALMIRLNGPIALTACLNMGGVDCWRWTSGEATLTRLLAAVVVHPFDVEGVKMAGKDTENREANVDEQI